MPLEVFRGDNLSFRVTVRDKCKRPKDTTGWTIDFTLRERDDSPTALVTKSSTNPGEIDEVDASVGAWDVHLLPADTDQEAGSYALDVQCTTSDVTPKIYTGKKDTLEIMQDVTR